MFQSIKDWHEKRRREKFLKRKFGASGINPAHLKEALHTLRVHASHSGVPRPAVGICGNVSYYLQTEHNFDYWKADNCYTVLCRLFEGWPKHSGDRSWPISENYIWRRWERDNLEQRLALIDYTINRLETLR